MSIVSKLLIGLAGLAFLMALIVAQIGPIGYVPAESFSRACSNLALLGIGLSICTRGGSKAA
jgi:hypothetical protein